MGNNASTGFVIPENYLRPKGGGGPKHRKPSLSDSDDDDDDDDSSSSDSSSDEETTTRKAHTMTSKSSTRPNTKGPSLINHTQSARKERDDDIPLAMYKSKGRVWNSSTFSHISFPCHLSLSYPQTLFFAS